MSTYTAGRQAKLTNLVVADLLHLAGTLTKDADDEARRQALVNNSAGHDCRSHKSPVKKRRRFRPA